MVETVSLAVIKYYENRNKSVLVLCPKKLANNWNTYKDNYVNNPIAADRMRYDVLFHTDLSREDGTSNGLDLDRLNWGNYDLVVIDESHNFRNGGRVSQDGDKENRYLKLLNKVIRIARCNREIHRVQNEVLCDGCISLSSAEGLLKIYPQFKKKKATYLRKDTWLQLG